MIKLIANYVNGNTNICLYEDGTRTITSEDNDFNFDYPISADIKITNQCFMGCKFCHENSVPEGKHAPLENFQFLDSWIAGVEAALGGGMVTNHPQFEEILQLFKEKGIVTNVTFHQEEFINNYEKIVKWQREGLIKGIGVSLTKPKSELANFINSLNHVVIHVINGIFVEKDYEWIMKNIERPKVLILGYKIFRRGKNFFDTCSVSVKTNKDWLYDVLPSIMSNFTVVSFDNLALEQLDVKDAIGEQLFNQFYQGDEGTCSMFIDAVKGEFCVNSTATERFQMTDDIKEMFKKVKDVGKITE